MHLQFDCARQFDCAGYKYVLVILSCLRIDLKFFPLCAAATKATTVGYGRHLLAAMAPAPAMTKATTVGYGRHLLAAMAPAPGMTKATTVGYGRHLLAAMAPAPGMTKATTVGYGRHLLASAPAPGSKSLVLCARAATSCQVSFLMQDLMHCFSRC